MTEESDAPSLNPILKPIIDKIRSTVKMFRRSPKKNEILQNYVKSEFQKELNLILDCRTRWNSLAAMIERFHLIRTCIKKAFIDLRVATNFEEQEFNYIFQVMEALKPIRAAVEVICNRESNLITTDAALNLVISKLRAQKSSVSLELASSIKFRVMERRTELTKVLRYLHNRVYANEDEELADTITRTEVQNFLKKMLTRTRIGTVVGDEESNDTPANEDFTVQPSAAATFKDELNEIMKKAMTPPTTEKSKKSQTLLTTLRQEMKLFEDGGTRGYNLSLIYDYLLTVKPTSVESERAFSVSGYVCNKFRSRLSDSTLDDLCYLKSYFKRSAE